MLLFLDVINPDWILIRQWISKAVVTTFLQEKQCKKFVDVGVP